MIEPTRSPDVEATATLDEVVRRRADLYQAILGLERAAARPAVEREDEWVAGVLEALAELQGRSPTTSRSPSGRVGSTPR